MQKVAELSLRSAAVSQQCSGIGAYAFSWVNLGSEGFVCAASVINIEGAL